MLRLFSSWPATSSATFGRASKFAPTVPIGIRRSLTRRPFSSVHEPISRSSGSISATASTCSARLSTRASSRRSRSSIPSSMRSTAASQSAAFAARISVLRSRTSTAAPLRAEATASSVRLGAARRASRASSSTDSRSPATAATRPTLARAGRPGGLLRGSLRWRPAPAAGGRSGRPDRRDLRSASPSAGRETPRRATR